VSVGAVAGGVIARRLPRAFEEGELWFESREGEAWELWDLREKVYESVPGRQRGTVVSSVSFDGEEQQRHLKWRSLHAHWSTSSGTSHTITTGVCPFWPHASHTSAGHPPGGLSPPTRAPPALLNLKPSTPAIHHDSTVFFPHPVSRIVHTGYVNWKPPRTSRE
jgi:hypothetical protein